MPTTKIIVSWDIEADVTLEDGSTHRVGPFGPRDLIAAERYFSLPSDLIRSMPRTEHLAFCAYEQLRRRGVFSGETNFDTFIDRLAGVTAEREMTVDEAKAKIQEAKEEKEEPGLAMAPSPNGSP